MRRCMQCVAAREGGLIFYFYFLQRVAVQQRGLIFGAARAEALLALLVHKYKN